MMPIADLQPWVTLIKDIVTILAAIIAGCVAIAGLGAWRKQLAGKTEYEAARRLLKATYTVREAINAVRNPYIGAGEIALAMKLAGIENLPDPSNIPPEVIGAAYRERWSSVTDAMSNLAAEAFEAEVLWGDAVQSLLKPLRLCVAELYGALQIYIGSLSRTISPRQSKEERKPIEATVYGTLDPETDKLHAKVLGSVAAIEQFVRPYLKARLAPPRRRPKKSRNSGGNLAEGGNL